MSRGAPIASGQAPSEAVVGSGSERAREDAARTLEVVHGMRDDFIELLTQLAGVESPTDRPDTIKGVHAILVPALEALGFEVRVVPGRVSGNHLLALPKRRTRGAPAQLLIGHSDTVWPLGTLERMPVALEGDRLSGPGTLDMKGGLAQIVVALRSLRALGHEPGVTPVIFVNADEEVGSPDSARHVRRLARRVARALVLEPSLEPGALIKTARKGIGSFRVEISGRAAHAGLDPGSGASAILELAHVVMALDSLNDPESGTTVNVGVMSGGTRPNVVAAEARAEVDVRVVTMDDGRRVEDAIRAIAATVPGVSLRIQGGVRIPPLERTPRNRALWESAKAVAGELGLPLEEGLAGGGSDGNTTSLHTATLDGLGCVGDGAHADHEHILIGPTLDRCALLARLLLTPVSSG